jgi:hypothetical protein
VSAAVGLGAGAPPWADVAGLRTVGDNQHMAFFRSRTLLVTVGVITVVALSMSMAVMFI